MSQVVCYDVDVKLHEFELHFELLPHPIYSPDLISSDYYLFEDLNEDFQKNSSEEVMAETEAYCGKC